MSYLYNTLSKTFSNDVSLGTGFVTTYNGVTTPDSTLSFDTTTKIFTIAPTGTSFSFYSSGTKFTKLVAQTVDLTSIWANNTVFYIYFNSSGILSAMSAPWHITSPNSPVATVLWNGTASFAIIGEERHSATRNAAWHEWAHDNIGSLCSSGFDATFSSSSTVIQSGVITDEDIQLPVSTQTDSLRLVYKIGSTLTYDDTLSAISAKTSAGVLQYDENGTLTSVTDGYYIKNIIVVTNSVAGPVACRIAQSQHANINDARNSSNPNYSTYLSNETKEIYSVIWKNVGGTPTLIEYIDYRKAPSLPNGQIARTPTYLGNLVDVSIPSPSIDEVLKWNGFNWTNGAPASASASIGIEFFPDDATIIPAGTQSTYPIKNLSKTPVTTTEDVDTITLITANTVYMYGVYLYDLPLGRTVIDAGVWNFDIFCGVDSATGVTRLIQNVNRVRLGAGTVTITGTGTTRTVIASEGTPFSTSNIDVNSSLDITSFLQTSSGLYPITARTSDLQVSILVPTTYTNQSTVTFSVHKKLFGVTTAELNNISGTAPTWTGLSQQILQSVQNAFSIEVTDKLSTSFFGVSTSNNRSVQFAHNGTARYSHLSTPLVTLHNNLAGLQGGTSNEFYHLTAAEKTALATLISQMP